MYLKNTVTKPLHTTPNSQMFGILQFGSLLDDRALPAMMVLFVKIPLPAQAFLFSEN